MTKTRNESFVPAPDHYAVPLTAIVTSPIREDQAFDELCSSVQLMGILQPVVLLAQSHKSYKIIAGRRRCAACLKLGIGYISAVVFPAGTDEAFIDVASITENSVRSDNIGSDVLAMKHLVDDGERDVNTLSQKTGLPKGRIKQLFELIDLPEIIVNGIVAGTVAPTTAKEVRKLAPTAMKRAITMLEENGKLTGKDIHTVKESQITDASSQIVLPEIPDLFKTEPGTITVAIGTPEHGKTVFDGSEDREAIRAVLASDFNDARKLMMIGKIVGFYDEQDKVVEVKAPAASASGTLAQRNRKKA